MADKAKIAALILAKRKPAEPAENAGSDQESAAEELIAAIKDGDAKGTVEAFKALCDSVDNDEE